MEEIKTYNEILSEEDKETLIKIEPNTILIFQHYKFKDYIYPVFLSCVLLRDSITIDRISEIIYKFEKSKNIPDSHKIKKALQRLLDKKYLIRHKNGTYSIINQRRVNIYNIQKFAIKFLNFYDSKFIFKKWQMKYYIEQSKETSLKNFLFGELLGRYSFEVPVTNEAIKKDLLLSRYEVNKIKDISSEPYHINHYNSNDTSFYNINNNFSCIGKKIYKNFFALNFEKSEFLKDKIFFIDENLLDQWGDVVNHSKKISLIKKKAGIKTNGSLSAREITTCYPAFFSKDKRNHFLPMLSEKLILNGLKKNNFMRRDIIRNDKDMLWWKDQKDLENYSHPYKYDSPTVKEFHLQK